MIHPFAHFSAAPAPGESLCERASALEKPAADFAEFLKTNAAGAHVSAPRAPRAEAPPRAASSVAPSRAVPDAPRWREAAAGNVAAQPASAAPGGNSPETMVNGNSAARGTAAGAASGPPRHADVPDSAKFPAGPYRQAPLEYGGEWWLVSPFTGEQPWLSRELAAAARPQDRYAAENLPADFLQAFGEMPVRRGGESGAEFSARLTRWKQDLEYFHKSGIPDGLDEAQIALASAAYEQWGMGAPVFYEGRYGWFARFPDSALPEFEMDAASAVAAPHLAIARYQVRQLQNGVEIAQPHPFVPPHLLGEDA